MEIDRKSAHILVKLEELEEATAGELRDALGFEQNQSVHYRMDNKLIPKHLVTEKPERKEQAGSRKAARVYRISPDGRDWVNSHGHEITLTDLDAAEQEIQWLSAELRDLSSDVQSLKKWRQEQAGRSGGMSKQLTELGEQVDSLETLVEKHEQRDYSEIWDRFNEIENQTGRLGTRLNNAARASDVKQVEQEVEQLTSRVDSLSTQIEDLQSSHADWSDWGNRAEDRIQMLEQHTSRGFLGRLKWLLFG